MPKSHSRVLVVDDHLDTLALLDAYLSIEGFQIVPARSVAEAMPIALGDIDAITTDLGMPGTDGFSFIRQVRSARASSPIPIVVITGQVLKPADVLDAGVFCCRLVSKPCDLTALAQTLRSLIEGCARHCACCPDRQAAGGRW